MLWALTGPTNQYELEADWALLGLNACTIRPTKSATNWAVNGPRLGRSVNLLGPRLRHNRERIRA